MAWMAGRGGDLEKVATLIRQAADVAEPSVHLFADKIANTMDSTE